MSLTKEEQNYITKCRLSLENYLELEKRFFEFADTIYVWDQWDKKEILSTLSLANLLTNICIGLEESLKLLLFHPLNNLKDEFIKHIEKMPATKIGRKENRIKEIEKEDYREISLNHVLDFKDFRKLLNNAGDQIMYVRPPLTISIQGELFGKKDHKPLWYKVYEETESGLTNLNN